jgi:hypothetical protein
MSIVENDSMKEQEILQQMYSGKLVSQLEKINIQESIKPLFVNSTTVQGLIQSGKLKVYKGDDDLIKYSELIADGNTKEQIFLNSSQVNNLSRNIQRITVSHSEPSSSSQSLQKISQLEEEKIHLPSLRSEVVQNLAGLKLARFPVASQLPQATKASLEWEKNHRPLTGDRRSTPQPPQSPTHAEQLLDSQVPLGSPRYQRPKLERQPLGVEHSHFGGSPRPADYSRVLKMDPMEYFLSEAGSRAEAKGY